MILRIILTACLLFAFGCAHCEEKDCPSEDAVFLMTHPRIPFPVRAHVPKGFFNEENKDKVGGWQSFEDYMEGIEKCPDGKGEEI